MINWKETYSTGVKELDEQHKSLFQFTNDLGNSLHEKDTSTFLLMGCLEFMRKYITNHFDKEESCMHKYSCPIAGTNTQAHQNFIRAFNTFEEDINKGADKYKTFQGFHKFLEDWLVAHIGSIDVHLRPCVNKGSE